MRWNRGFVKAKCPRCRGALEDDGKCGKGHGTFVPNGAAEAGPPEHRRLTGEEPLCPGCGAPMDVVLEAADEVLAASCAKCSGLWLAVGDARTLQDLLQG